MTKGTVALLAGVLALGAGTSLVLASEKGASWTYEGREGPVHWGDLSSAYATCKTGKMQSPIDINAANAPSAVAVSFDYRPVTLEILNNGHTVQFNVGNGSTMTSHGQTYKLLQVHFHTPSEHVVRGKHYAMEAHFVHKRADGALGVIGVLFKEGRENEAIAGLFKHLPMRTKKATLYADVTMDPRALIPSRPSFYRYMGSLTTPPCSEGVNWFVVETPVQASRAQISAMTKAFGENARPAQVVNNRLILSPLN